MGCFVKMVCGGGDVELSMVMKQRCQLSVVRLKVGRCSLVFQLPAPR